MTTIQEKLKSDYSLLVTFNEYAGNFDDDFMAYVFGFYRELGQWSNEQEDIFYDAEFETLLRFDNLEYGPDCTYPWETNHNGNKHIDGEYTIEIYLENEPTKEQMDHILKKSYSYEKQDVVNIYLQRTDKMKTSKSLKNAP